METLSTDLLTNGSPQRLHAQEPQPMAEENVDAGDAQRIRKKREYWKSRRPVIPSQSADALELPEAEIIAPLSPTRNQLRISGGKTPPSLGGTSPMDISNPFNVVHRSHVDFNYQWTLKNPKDSFELLGMLGSGTFGTVFRASQKETAFQLAIKVVKIKDGGSEEVTKEMNILQKLKHPHIVSYYGCCTISPTEIWLLMEYCDVGSVRDFMEMWPEALTEAQIATILGDTLLGLAYLHGHNIAHRDIKAANILLDGTGRSKIGDFGVAGQLTHSVGKLQDFVGTVLFMAPEMLKEKAMYDLSADVWALGITAIEIAEQGQVPYCNDRMMTAIRKIINNPAPTFSEPAKWSTSFRDFLAIVLQKDPKKRPTANVLLQTSPYNSPPNHVGFLSRVASSASFRSPIHSNRVSSSSSGSATSNPDTLAQPLIPKQPEERSCCRCIIV